MSTLPKQRMTVDEFLVWAEGRPGRYELESGQIVAMAPELLRHMRAKGASYKALDRAILAARRPCEALPDGATIRVARDVAYEPDVVVYCGERLPDNAVEVPEPTIVVEVLSPSTGALDKTRKMKGYFSLPSLRHYLIVDPEDRIIVHHSRGDGDVIATRILSSGPLRLDPPGIEVTIEEMFPD